MQDFQHLSNLGVGDYNREAKATTLFPMYLDHEEAETVKAQTHCVRNSWATEVW